MGRIGGNKRIVMKVVRKELMVKKMKGVKVATMVGIIVEMLKSEDISIIDWLLRIFKRCIESCVSSRYTNGKVRRECDKL